jgi:hypothetical protein
MNNEENIKLFKDILNECLSGSISQFAPSNVLTVTSAYPVPNQKKLMTEDDNSNE